MSNNVKIKYHNNSVSRKNLIIAHLMQKIKHTCGGKKCNSFLNRKTFHIFILHIKKKSEKLFLCDTLLLFFFFLAELF